MTETTTTHETGPREIGPQDAGLLKAGPGNFFQEWTDYLVDTTQRTILFWDVMRKRGNNYLEHIKQGQPPVLVF